MTKATEDPAGRLQKLGLGQSRATFSFDVSPLARPPSTCPVPNISTLIKAGAKLLVGVLGMTATISLLSGHAVLRLAPVVICVRTCQRKRWGHPQTTKRNPIRISRVLCNTRPLARSKPPIQSPPRFSCSAGPLFRVGSAQSLISFHLQTLSYTSQNYENKTKQTWGWLMKQSPTHTEGHVTCSNKRTTPLCFQIPIEAPLISESGFRS